MLASQCVFLTARRRRESFDPPLAEWYNPARRTRSGANALKKQLGNLIKLLVSVGLLLLLFRLIDPQAALAVLAEANLALMALAVALFQATQVIRAFRWQALLLAVEVDVPIWRLIYLYYVGTFFNTFLPSGFGGDAVKMYELNRYSHKGSESVGTVLVDRLVGLVALFGLGLAAWPFAVRALPRLEGLILLGVCCVGLAGSWLLFQRRLVETLLRVLPGKVGAALRKLYDAVHACGTKALWRALGYSVAFNIVLFAMVYVIGLALDVHLPFLYFAALMPIISLSMLVPSVGALGTREGAYVLAFANTGLTSPPKAMALSLGFYLVNVITGIIGALLYAANAVGEMRQRRFRSHRQGGD